MKNIEPSSLAANYEPIANNLSQRNINSYGNNQNQSEYIDLNIHKNAF